MVLLSLLFVWWKHTWSGTATRCTSSRLRLMAVSLSWYRIVWFLQSDSDLYMARPLQAALFCVKMFTIVWDCFRYFVHFLLSLVPPVLCSLLPWPQKNFYRRLFLRKRLDTKFPRKKWCWRLKELKEKNSWRKKRIPSFVKYRLKHKQKANQLLFQLTLKSLNNQHEMCLAVGRCRESKIHTVFH